MCSVLDLHEKIARYHDCVAQPHHRYRSWEHCYEFFRDWSRKNFAAEQRNAAALQLGFFLASWGMYRGASFLLKHTYTIHEAVIGQLVSDRFADLWVTEAGAEDADAQRVQLILEAVAAVRKAYEPFGVPTDTLVTKILLGTLACLPACDRFFIKGFRTSNLAYSRVNRRFVERVHGFCTNHLTELRQEQTRIRQNGRGYYPLMKLVDMYFWQVGADGRGSRQP